MKDKLYELAAAMGVVIISKDLTEFSNNKYDLKGMYDPGRDLIYLEKNLEEELLPVVLLHELVHATGHPTRLDRVSLSQYLRRKYYQDLEETIVIGAAECFRIEHNLPEDKSFKEMLREYLNSNVEFGRDVWPEINRALNYLNSLEVFL